MNISIHLHFHCSQTDKEEPDDLLHFDAGQLEQAMMTVLEKAKKQKSSKTYANYCTAMRSFLHFIGSEHVAGTIDASTLAHYERWLQQQGVCLNTVSCYMRSLRSLLRSIDENSGKLFRNVFTGNQHTDKRAVNEQAINKLQNLQLKENSFLALARDVFLFCFFAQGMPFADAARLRHSQIKDDTITYFRQKTHQRIVVSMEPCIQSIIERYRTPGRDFVFPLFSSSDDSLIQHEYPVLLNRYNRALKTLARQAGMEANLTSYVARHSWASLAFKSSVELPVISKALGHTNPQTTLVYIKEIDDQRLSEANHNLLQKFRDDTIEP